MQKQVNLFCQNLFPNGSGQAASWVLQPLVRRSLLIGLTIAGLVTGVMKTSAIPDPVAASTSPSTPLATTSSKSAEPEAVLDSAIPVTTTFPQAGLYLYGQSAEPEKIGQAYLVFEVRGAQVVGAFYMPASSFDCFYGEIQANKLALTVIDSYERTRHPYQIALEEKDPIAGTTPMVAELSLQGYYPLQVISPNDQRILNVCKTQNFLPI